MLNAAERAKQAKEERRKKWTSNGHNEETKKKKDLPTPKWEKLVPTSDDLLEEKLELPKIPFVILTVDTPIYRTRYKETKQHVDGWLENCGCSSHCVHAQSYDLLNLEEHPEIGVKRILSEGWRQIFLPQILLHQSSIPFVLAAEDDIRIPNTISPCALVDLCQRAFQNHPTIDVLGLGHSWKAAQKRDDVRCGALLDYLQETSHHQAGVHGTTLMAVRFPEGIQRLQEALEKSADGGSSKFAHLDQFLFYSPHHNLQIALCDPPLVGWAEVETTLTKSSSGFRRQGGGRLGHLPSVESGLEVMWIQRYLEQTPL